MGNRKVVTFGLGVAAGAAVVLAALWVRPSPEPAEAVPSAEEAAMYDSATRVFERLHARMDAMEYEPVAEARESALLSDLQTLRSQIELYRIQHRDRYPSQDEGESLAAMDGEEFVSDLVNGTNAAGSRDTSDDELALGPYLRSFPANPFVADEVRAAQVRIGAGPVPEDCDTGWYFDTNSGRISPGDAAHRGL